MRVVTSFDPSSTSTIPSGPQAGQMGGTFDLKQTGNVKFKVKNDSNISIHLFFPNGTDSIVVAGEEMLFCSGFPTSIISWIQDVTLNVNGSPLVSKVYVTIYDQTDREQGTYPFHITRLANLGNNVPIDTTVTTLSNEGNAANLLVIDMGDTGNAQLVRLYNDGHALWYVDQSGTPHLAFGIYTSGNPLRLGQAGDNTEIVGNLVVDQTTFLSTTDIFSSLIMENNQRIQWKDSGGTARNILSVNSSNDTIFQYPSGQNVRVQDQSNNDVLTFSNAGLTLKFGAIQFLVGSMTRISGNVS